MALVKICGLTSWEDAAAAVRFGADYLGFVFAESPRRVTPDQARSIIRGIPERIQTVGVFVDAAPELVNDMKRYCNLASVQLHGDETEDDVALIDGPVIKGLRVSSEAPEIESVYPSATLLLDTYCATAHGGTGKTFDWRLAEKPARLRPVILAGGLNAENVSEAIITVRPFAVDVSSGVESGPGRKDHEKLERFIRTAKSVARSS